MRASGNSSPTSRGRDLVHVDAAQPVERGDPAVLLEPVRVAGDLDEPDRLEPGGQAGLGLEPGVQVAGVLAHLGRGLRRRAERHHQPGRVPGGAGGEPVALEQHDVLAQVGQVVGDRGADDAAADHDDAGALREDGLGHGREPRTPTQSGADSPVSSDRHAGQPSAAVATGSGSFGVPGGRGMRRRSMSRSGLVLGRGTRSGSTQGGGITWTDAVDQLDLPAVVMDPRWWWSQNRQQFWTEVSPPSAQWIRVVRLGPLRRPTAAVEGAAAVAGDQGPPDRLGDRVGGAARRRAARRWRRVGPG